MIIIKLSGGLGNQMFQYAFGRSVAIKRNQKLFLDLSYYQSDFRKDTYRSFKLDQFNIKAEFGIALKIKNYKKILWRIINKNGLFLTSDFHVRFHKIFYWFNIDYFDGFFQSFKYFKDISAEIRKELTLKNKLSPEAEKIKNEIQQSNSVSIHFRRGDYISNKNNFQNYGICSLDYYDEAIRKIKILIKNPKFFIFSDDIKWVKKNFKINDYVEYISYFEFQEIEEFELMRQCKHNIISNSTFSWWAAWLNNNPNKVVITPIKWTKKKNFKTNDLIFDNWIKI